MRLWNQTIHNFFCIFIILYIRSFVNEIPECIKRGCPP